MSGTGLRRALRLQAIRFFRLRGSSERGARGFAAGIVCSFLPTFGLGGFLAGFLAHVLRGNAVAGFLGGSILAPVWPLLFYLNIRVGSLFIRPPLEVDDLGDVTPVTIDALVWGRTFAIGAAVNGTLAALAAYVLFLLAYDRLKAPALRHFQATRRPRTQFADAGRKPKNRT